MVSANAALVRSQSRPRQTNVFRTRLLTAIVLIPLAVAAIALGGMWFFTLVTLILVLAAIEFCRLMEHRGFAPVPALAVALVLVFLLDAQFPQWSLLGPGMSLVLMGSLAWQMAHREGNPVPDWALAVAGALYVGWCGAYLLRLRNIPGGLWWVMTTLPAIWVADSGAYTVGRTWGRHKLAPTLSPGKTWEGYIGGVITGTLFSTGLAALWQLRALAMAPSPAEGLVLGFLLSTLAPLGDLVVSMFKRYAGAKDSGSILPGHGGALDRVDSLLWAGVIGYYFALWFGGF